MLAQQQENNLLTQQIEKQRIDQSDIQKAKELSEALSQLKASNELMIKAKDEQIIQLSAQLEGIKSAQSIDDFRIEATRINSALISQIRLLCQQLVEAVSLCETSTAVCELIEKARSKLDQAEDDITEYIEWQDTPEGTAANLSRIHVTYKDILFMEWNTQVMIAERAASR